MSMLPLMTAMCKGVMPSSLKALISRLVFWRRFFVWAKLLYSIAVKSVVGL